MATSQTTHPNRINRDDRAMLNKGIDAMIASIGRKAASEENAQIKKMREDDIEKYVALKNKLMTIELEL